MFNEFFGFEDNPFPSKPDPACFYRSAQHDATLRSLLFAVQARKGLTSLIGEAGTGKTLVLECLRDSLQSIHIPCAFLRDSRVSTNRFFQAIASNLNLPCQETSAYQVFLSLRQFMSEQARSGRTVALIVDEAHNLPADVFNEILDLASLHDNQVKLLQTVLAGRTGFQSSLDALNLERLRQRAILNCTLRPFSEQETREYIEFRLAHAGLQGRTVFSPEAIAQIHQRSQGFAPAIHELCENLLLTAFSLRSRVCTQQVLDQAFGRVYEEARLVTETAAPVEVVAETVVPEPSMAAAVLPPAFEAAKGSLWLLPVPIQDVVDPNGTISRIFLPPWSPAIKEAGLAVASQKPARRRDAVKAARVIIRRVLLLGLTPRNAGPVLSDPLSLGEPQLSPATFTADHASPAAPPVLAIETGSENVQPGLSGSIEPVRPAADLRPVSASEERIALAPLAPGSQPPATAARPSSSTPQTIEFSQPAPDPCPSVPGWNLRCDSAIPGPTGSVPQFHQSTPVPASPRINDNLSMSWAVLKPRTPALNLEPVNPRPALFLLSTPVPLEALLEQARPARSFSRAWLPKLAVLILAGLGLYAARPVLDVAADSLQHGWQGAHQAILARGAVAIDEDFRKGLGNWMNRGGASPFWTMDAAGFVRPGALALYRPSLSLADYQLQFLGTIDKKELSWVARAADFNNYQAIQVTVLKPGPIPTVAVTRYAVIDGKTQNRVTTPLLISARPDTIYRVRLDVQGDRYALSIQDQAVDSWSERRLRRGGIGFFSENDAESRIAGVEVKGQFDMLGRFYALLAPAGIASYRESLNENAAIALTAEMKASSAATLARADLSPEAGLTGRKRRVTALSPAAWQAPEITAVKTRNCPKPTGRVNGGRTRRTSTRSEWPANCY